MTRGYSTQDLWNLINRITTKEQVVIADRFITRHYPTNQDGTIKDVDEFNDMIESCWHRYDEIIHPERYC